MDGFCHQFLARPRLAQHQDAEIIGKNPGDGAIDFLHRRRAPDQRQAIMRQPLFRRISAARSMPQGVRNSARQLIEIERLWQIFERPLLGRPDRGVQGVLCRKNDNIQVGLALDNLRHAIQPIAIRQHDVGDQNVRRKTLHQRRALADRSGDLHLVPLAPQSFPYHHADGGIIIDDQDRARRGHQPIPIGSRMRKVDSPAS